MVARMMAAENVGAIPVVADLQSKTLVGIVTDRDLALTVVANGLDPKLTPVSFAMSGDPTISCDGDEQVGMAINLMEDAQIRRIPVIDSAQHLLGIITTSDIISKLNNPSKTLEMVEALSCCHVPKTIFEAAPPSSEANKEFVNAISRSYNRYYVDHDDYDYGLPE
jgi:CBS-domain-containing membrane protein